MAPVVFSTVPIKALAFESYDSTSLPAGAVGSLTYSSPNTAGADLVKSFVQHELGTGLFTAFAGLRAFVVLAGLGAAAVLTRLGAVRQGSQ